MVRTSHSTVQAFAPRADFHRAFRVLLAAGTPEIPLTDIAQFIGWLEHHRLAPLLPALRELPASWRSRLRDAWVRAAATELERAASVGPLVDALQRTEIRVVAFKGLGLAHLKEVYAKPEMRVLGDLDLIIPADELDDAVRVLSTLGYRAPSSKIASYRREWSYEFSLSHPRFGVCELHHRAYEDIPPELFDTFLGRTETIDVYGRRVECLAAPDLLLFLVVHLAKSQQAVVWIWLVDIERLGNTLDPLEWAKLADSAASSGLALHLSTALAALKRLWGVRPSNLAADVETRLEDALQPIEIRARAQFLTTLFQERPRGDLISFAWRMARRRPTATSLLARAVPPRSRVALEYEVAADDPWMWAYRLRFFLSWTRRAARRAGALARSRRSDLGSGEGSQSLQGPSDRRDD